MRKKPTMVGFFSFGGCESFNKFLPEPEQFWANLHKSRKAGLAQFLSAFALLRV
jgi:hypothetical protein